MTFQEQLLSHRKQLGLSQEQLGNQIGVSRQAVSKWELGETTPEMEKLIQLSRIFGISIDELVGNIPAQKPKETVIREKTVEVRFCRWHYEYKSKRTLFGLPLLHINIGRGMYRAKGVLAVGAISKGILSIGGASMGVFSFGGASCGVFSIGGLSLALLLAVGGFAAGTIAIGGLALGILAIGGCAVGMYAVGGAAIAGKIAAGGYAAGPIAIGDGTNGEIAFDIHAKGEVNALSDAIARRFPHTWRCIVELFGSILR